MNGIIPRTEKMPCLPQPFSMRNWRQVALDYDRLIFDFEAKGDFLPLPYLDNSRTNWDGAVVAIPSYINSREKRKEGLVEGINLISAVLGGALCGAEEENRSGCDFVDMLQAFFNKANGQNLFLNRFDTKTGGSFWYETYTGLLMCAVGSRFEREWLTRDLRIQADRYVDAVAAMGGKDADFFCTAFDFAAMKPVFNGVWREPEGAAGFAYILYDAYCRFGEQKYLDACICCMDYLERIDYNPYYEILMPYGAALAARLNAEQGCSYSVEKMVSWCFDGDSRPRNGWGVIADRWGEYDCHGLVGSLTDTPFWPEWDAKTGLGRWKGTPVGDEIIRYYHEKSAGYAFAANTFSMGAALLPLVRYDPRFAHDVGKWFLNMANAARLFYPGAHPPKNQSCGFFTDDPYNCIAYEGLRKYYDGRSPYATGDPIRFAWGSIDIGLYGSSHVGLMGCTVHFTSDPAVLMLDCGITDFIGGKKKPCYLVYNPYSTEKTVLYNENFVKECKDYHSGNPAGSVSNGELVLTLPPDSAMVIELNFETKQKHID